MRDEAYDHVDPYADGTYGTNYTPASIELERDKREEFSRQQTIVLSFATRMGTYGITGGDVKNHYGWETNAVSRTLSNLLRDGQLVRLKETRGKAHVHVLPQWVDGRDVLPYQSTNTKHRLAALREARVVVDKAGSWHDALLALAELIAREES